MKIPIIQIGNSRGIRLGKLILEKYGLKDEVEVIMKEDHLIIRAVESPRRGWDEAFRRMHEQRDDSLLIDDVFEDEGDEL
jgi:antitoxin MazE